MWKEGKNMQGLKPNSKENAKKSIIAIGQELIKRADDITKDLKCVTNIEINANLTPSEIINFDIKKKYIAMYEGEEEK